MRWSVAVALTLVALTTRSLFIAHPHSGQGAPPLRGDYEAQRHWMEITSQLPVREWYWGNDTRVNNLQYWGLDYPPLTAYHSAVLGHVGLAYHPHAFALLSSRGAEDIASKAFMRLTVLVSDLLVYIPAVLLFAAVGGDGELAALFPLVQPALLLIDHGHFQFNGVCLGLVAWAAACVSSDRSDADELLGSVLFVFALCFKHMALYFAPAFFVFLLSRSLARPRPVLRVARIGVVVVAAFALLFWPLRYDVAQVFRRLFPVGRGIFEDKVANFWCSLSLVVKLKQRFSAPQLFQLAAAATLASIVPSCVLLFRRPSRRMFTLALAAVSLCFFLFSFQVHEKSILMPLLPITLLHAHHTRFATWVTAVACFSMYPLLVRDGLALAYAASMLGLLALGQWSLVALATVPIALAVHALMAFVPPPPALPHLWIMACTASSFVAFAFTLVYLHVLQWRELKTPA